MVVRNRNAAGGLSGVGRVVGQRHGLWRPPARRRGGLAEGIDMPRAQVGMADYNAEFAWTSPPKSPPTCEYGQNKSHHLDHGCEAAVTQ